MDLVGGLFGFFFWRGMAMPFKPFHLPG